MRAADNPFAAVRLDALGYRPQEIPWPRLLERLAALSFRAEIRGPEGHGKTTLLEALATALRRSGVATAFVRLTREEPRLTAAQWAVVRALDAHTVLFLDGADLLPRSQWWLLRARTRHALGLVLTTHARRMLPPLCEARTSPSLLAALAFDLAGPRFTDLVPSSAELHARHAGDLRAALRELYDRASVAW